MGSSSWVCRVGCSWVVCGWGGVRSSGGSGWGLGESVVRWATILRWTIQHPGFCVGWTRGWGRGCWEDKGLLFGCRTSSSCVQRCSPPARSSGLIDGGASDVVELLPLVVSHAVGWAVGTVTHHNHPCSSLARTSPSSQTSQFGRMLCSPAPAAWRGLASRPSTSPTVCTTGERLATYFAACS